MCWTHSQVGTTYAKILHAVIILLLDVATKHLDVIFNFIVESRLIVYFHFSRRVSQLLVS